jgi:hypothetical protein
VERPTYSSRGRKWPNMAYNPWRWWGWYIWGLKVFFPKNKCSYDRDHLMVRLQCY